MVETDAAPPVPRADIPTDLTVERSYGVVIRKGRFLSPHARAFVNLVKPGLFARGDYFEGGGHSER